MKEPNKRQKNRARGGFTLIEVIAATVLLVITASGFMMMTASNTRLLAKEHRIDSSNYELGAAAVSGEGAATGETLTVEFSLENEEHEKDQNVIEVFEQYRVSETGDGWENFITFYRHR